MRPEEMAAAWDSLLASEPSRASTTASASSAAAPLRLNRQPERHHLPAQPRSLSLIDPNLRTAVRGLVSAELPWPLSVSGAAGVGKTCAALCLLDYAAGVTHYHTAAGLCRRLIDAEQGRLTWYSEGRGGPITAESIWSGLAGAALVVLDELGCRDKVSDHHYESVKRVIDDRFGKPLVVLSNLDLGALAGVYDDRVASRLSAGTVVRLQGQDRRLARE